MRTICGPLPSILQPWIYYTLRLSHELLARGTEVSRWQYLIHATGETAIFDMACLADVTEFPFRLQCEQFQLTELLAERLTEHPLCDIRFDVEFVDCHQDASGVDVSVIDQGREASIRCDWLLSADGAKSGVRKALGQTFEGQVFSKTSITLVIDHDFRVIFPDCWSQLRLVAQHPLQFDAVARQLAVHVFTCSRSTGRRCTDRVGCAIARGAGFGCSGRSADYSQKLLHPSPTLP